MANVFSDIFEAIRVIRQKKGTTETNIMTYVHDRLGKGISIRTVLKTMNTLKRLVDSGLLIKKGNRYILPLPSDNCQEKKEENGDDCMDDDDEDNDEDNEDNNDDCDEDEGEEDEDEEDEDDDDDGDDCNMDENVEGKDENGGERKKKDLCQMDEGADTRGSKNEGGDWEYKHIDSNIKKYMKSELNPVAGSFIRSKKKTYRTCRNQLFDEELDDMSGDRSPARESSEDIDLLMDVEEVLHESEVEAQFINKNLSFGYEEGDRPEGYSTYRDKSPNGPPPPNARGARFELRESRCSHVGLKVGGLVEADPDFTAEGDKKYELSGNVYKKQTKKRAQDGSYEGCKEESASGGDNPTEKPNGQTGKHGYESFEKRRNTPEITPSVLITRETGSGDVS